LDRVGEAGGELHRRAVRDDDRCASAYVGDVERTDGGLVDPVGGEQDRAGVVEDPVPEDDRYWFGRLTA
jgi:hypothetical protein